MNRSLTGETVTGEAATPVVQPDAGRSLAYGPVPISIPWRSLLEVILIAGWALFVGRNYLALDPLTFPAGAWNEFGMTVQPHAIWTWLGECGQCVLWNGAVNGGNPAFAEDHGAPLHPLVILTTLLWGSIAGGKIVAVLSFLLAGIAQWWLGRVLGLGPLPRLWSALLVVTGGHLLARMDHGVVTALLSTASCSLLLAPILDLARTGRRRRPSCWGSCWRWRWSPDRATCNSG